MKKSNTDKDTVNPLCCWWLIWPIQNDAKNLKNDRNPGTCTHMRALSESYPMNTNMTGFILHPCALDESSLRIGRVKGILHQYSV